MILNINKNKVNFLFLSFFVVAIFLPSLGAARAQTAGSAQPSTSSMTPAQRCAALQQNLTITNNSNIVGSNLVTGAGLVSWCTPGQVIVTIFNLLSAFAGIVTVVFIVIGGYFYVVSAGNEEQAEKGRKILTNAVIGLVIIILAVTIVRIIGVTLSGATPAATGSATSGGAQATTNTAAGNTASPPATSNSADNNSTQSADSGPLAGITAQQVGDYLAASSPDYLKNDTGFGFNVPDNNTVTIDSQASDQNSLIQLKADCINTPPQIEVFNGSNQIATGVYNPAGAGLAAEVQVSPLPKVGDVLTIKDCNQLFMTHTVSTDDVGSGAVQIRSGP